MLTETDFRGPARRLADTDLPRIGKTILGCGEDEIHAVLEVETSGHGFDSKGRPVILFEPHVFYRRLGNTAARTVAVTRGLAYAKWGEHPYPKDSYPRLLEAVQIDETAALQACSWGLGQILGENYRLCGYATVQAMVHDMVQGEAEQLTVMATFVKASKLDGHLRAHDWAAFARGYNGAGYAKNNYDNRLAAAFARWQKIPDTSWSPDWRNDASMETNANPPADTPSAESTHVDVPVAPPSSAPASMPAPVPTPAPAPAPPAAPKSASGVVAAAVAVAAYFHDHPVVVVAAVAAIAVAILVGFKASKGNQA